jgi:hypothetical protein
MQTFIPSHDVWKHMVDLRKIDELTKTAVRNCCERIEKAKAAVKKNGKKSNGATMPGFKSKYM